MRLFVGFRPEIAVRDAFADVAHALGATVQARFVPPELYHITLAYLGERSANALPGLMALLEDTAAVAAPFALPALGLGFFGTPADAIVYAAFQQTEPLASLNEQLRFRLARAGESFDPRALVPHLTLARKAVLPDGLPLTLARDLSCPVEALTLFHSTREQGTLQYLPVGEAPLAREPRRIPHP
ncbi:MAG: RNA 2',3'-cyclic phosphodiesterase [Clostridiales bacterium]|nr:RNA 2',3'-cyclic phosphodiesterase [Clostridiales bacterium]